MGSPVTSRIISMPCGVCGAEDYRTTGEDTYSVRMFFLNWLFPKMHKK